MAEQPKYALTIDPMATEGKNEFEIENIEMETIAADARKERAVEKGEKPPEEDKDKTKETPAKEPLASETEEQKAAKAKADEAKLKEKEAADAAKKKEDEDKLVNTKDEDLDDGKKYQKLTILKAREEEAKKAEETALKAFADKHKLSVEQAREELGHISKILEKYKGDDKELPLAYLNMQRLYTKAQEDVKKLQEAVPIKSIEKLTDDDIVRDVIDAGKIKIKGVSATREQIIERYKATHPKLETVDDDTIISMVANDIRQGLITQRTNQLQEAKIKAKDKRVEVLNSISEADKDFTETVKNVVENTSDEAILSDSFSVQDIIRWAKGEKYDELVSKHTEELKKAHDEGFKKGQENGKILGIKGAETTPKEGNKGAKTVTLTEAQKKEALDMFDIPSMTDDEKYESYIEVKKLKEEKK